jgi:Domain of unknown function (DUF5919)
VSDQEARKSNLIDLRSRLDYQPDASTLARSRLASVRSRLGLSHADFAKALSSLIGWTPPPEAIDSWETVTVPPGDVIVAAELLGGEVPDASPLPGASPSNVAQLLSERFAGIAGVYATRSEFMSRVPIQDLFDGASEIRSSGLSLNLICQQYGDSRLCRLVEHGTTVRCLFLDPSGSAIAEREKEEGYSHGELAALTEMNIKTLNDRVRRRLTEEASRRLFLSTYNEVIRFNIVLIDDRVCIMQPYLPAVRGIDSPTFVITNNGSDGLYETFAEVFDSLWERGKPWT